MPVATTHRVEASTDDSLNEQFDQQLKANIEKYANATAAELDQRLAELDREWNVERIIEMQAPTAIALGAILGATVNRKWYVSAIVAASMVILHNVQGWYPLLPLLRRFGIRSQNEIEQERSALRALRGDHKVFQSHTHH
jgi:predicted phage tail protein